MGVFDFESLRPHAYHKISCVVYGVLNKDEKNVAIECHDCHEVLVDFDRGEAPGGEEIAVQQGDKHFFSIQINGTGKTRREAWEAAVKAFAADPQDPPEEPAIKKRPSAPAPDEDRDVIDEIVLTLEKKYPEVLYDGILVDMDFSNEAFEKILARLQEVSDGETKTPPGPA